MDVVSPTVLPTGTPDDTPLLRRIREGPDRCYPQPVRGRAGETASGAQVASAFSADPPLGLVTAQHWKLPHQYRVPEQQVAPVPG